MALPVNVGLNSNFDTGNIASGQSQIQSNQEAGSEFSSNFNVDNNIRLEDLANDITVSNSFISESKLKNFISGESLP